MASGLLTNLASAVAFPMRPKHRNVHVVLEESFWDPSPLIAAGLQESPLDPRFLRLWAATGYSRALSPAFAGQTANAEFEVLCGFPLDQATVKFEEGFNDHVPALPRILRDFGYRTVASHPNVPGFWNRQIAYEKLGFETFWSKADFIQDDMAGPFLSDRSLHAQVGNKLSDTDDGRPLFDYIVTFYGHWAYDASARRPIVIDTNSKVDEVTKYVNTVHYKSSEMMDAVAHLQASDPDSVIVLFGDHLPLLGRNFAGYTESGFLANSFGSFNSGMYARSAATPLIVIDGRDGPLKLGNVPMYRIGRIILDLIDYTKPNMLDLAFPPNKLLRNVALRPLPGIVVGCRSESLDDAWLCHPDGMLASGLAPRSAQIRPVDGEESDERDAETTAWLTDVKLLATDIFDGRQHALKSLIE